jgi:hypothetical protein
MWRVAAVSTLFLRETGRSNRRVKVQQSRLIRLAIAIVIGVLVTNVLAWECDLRGWRRDLVRGAPFLVAICWVLCGRGRNEASRGFRISQCEPRHGQRRKYRR